MRGTDLVAAEGKIADDKSRRIGPTNEAYVVLHLFHRHRNCVDLALNCGRHRVANKNDVDTRGVDDRGRLVLGEDVDGRGVGREVGDADVAGPVRGRGAVLEDVRLDRGEDVARDDRVALPVDERKAVDDDRADGGVGGRADLDAVGAGIDRDVGARLGEREAGESVDLGGRGRGRADVDVDLGGIRRAVKDADPGLARGPARPPPRAPKRDSARCRCAISCPI